MAAAFAGAPPAPSPVALPRAAVIEPRPDAIDEHITLAGLAAPAEIVVDRWGIAHITAASPDDLFFTQGFNAARDRLWQIDLWRRRGLGQLAEVFGPAYVEQDRAARLFLYRGDMEAEWQAYGPDTRPIVTRFVEGINAYVRWVRDDPSRLPPEFALGRYGPAEWAPEDVVRIRSHGLSRNVASEVERAQVVCRAGVELDTIRRAISPPWTVQRPEGLDPCSIPPDVLDVFRLASRGVTFDAGQRGARREPDADEAVEGSNNWAIAPSRSATGRAILANDPHRAHAIPSLRYIVHLTAPGLNVIGAGEPALPGVSIGHNDAIAFGLTIFAMDQEDLYVYETDPAAPSRYRYQGQFEPMRLVREEVRVRGEEQPRVVTLAFTRHGPVVREDPATRRAYAVRTVWQQPGTAPYLGSLRYVRARSLGEFMVAMERWGVPSLNHVYADVHGSIAWIPAGLAPNRRNWDGLLPVPGDGRYEWEGFIPRRQFPVAVNPKEGFVFSANEMNLPPGYPIAERRLGFEWADPSRAERVREVLLSRPRHTVEQAAALQMDVLSRHGLRLVRVLQSLRPAEATLADAIAWLGQWDGQLTEASPQGALVELWFARHLRPGLVARAVPEPLRAVVAPGDPTIAVALMEHPDSRLGPDPAAARDALMLDTLRAALAEAETRLGADRTRWAWGRLHTVGLDHPMAPLMDAAGQKQTRVGPMPKAGSAFVVSAASYRASDFRLTNGASFRMVVDVGNWDGSLTVNTPGQSGDPRSPHYADLFERWRTGQFVPMLYSAPAIDRAATRRIRLAPPN